MRRMATFYFLVMTKEMGQTDSQGARLMILNVEGLGRFKKRQTVLKTIQTLRRGKTWYVQENGRDTNICKRRVS